MAIKTWECEYKTHLIKFINEWTWDWYTKEELFVDWKSVVLQEKDMNSWVSMKDMIWGKISYKLDDGTIIEVIAWSAWHLFWTAAKILVNWKYIWWNKIVLFANKK